MYHRIRYLILAITLTMAAIDYPVYGQQAAHTENEPWVFGMSTALTGPAATLGMDMQNGVLAAFAEVNRAGGIRGHELQLIVLDDGYEPARTAPNMRELIDKHQVLAVVGNVGTPTAVAAIPIANSSQVPFLGAFTGAGVLRKSPPDRYVINYRASYAEETAAMIDMLIDQQGLKPEQIGFFTQRDSYGDAGYSGGIAALKRHGLADVSRIAHGRYERNTIAVENGLADLLTATPPLRAVIMVGAYRPCAHFIQYAHDYDFEAKFLNVSFVGAAPLAAALGEVGDGVLVTQVVPAPDSDLPITQNFRAALKAMKPEANASYGSLEGYVVGKIVIEALQKMRQTPTRESLIDTMESLGTFDLGLGNPLSLGTQEHQASHKIWWSEIRQGTVLPMQMVRNRNSTQSQN